jgi:ADP-ribosylglycohydrolase
MTTTQFPADYAERVYAGVLGKIIGVYLGRPFEGWSYDRLTKEFGEVEYYVNDVIKHPLIVADDDISGTFTFLRAMADHGYSAGLTAREIGQSWMNYLIEGRTVLWWGGLGNSTEHTAYLRLKHGIPAPASGSIETNGQVVAEQIGAQIFIDGWGLISPGNPALAARLAKEAGSVSHDGEAIYGAQVVAALIAAAFVEPNMDKMLDMALAQIPADCLIAKMIGEIRGWVAKDRDWRVTRQRIADNYGYDKFGGGCHMIPNHALIILALLYAPDDFSRALTIVNTCGWDTDCNSANVGTIMGVRVGLAGIDAGHDWRGPVADRILIPTAEGGGCVTDAVRQTDRVLRTAYGLAGREYEVPKGGARYHFAYPGAVQGWMAIPTSLGAPTAHVRNVACPDDPSHRYLAIHLHDSGAAQVTGAYVGTFFQPDECNRGGYGLYGSPTLYAGQQVTANLFLDPASPSVRARLAAIYYGRDPKPAAVAGDWVTLVPGQAAGLVWTVPDTDGRPVYQLRLEFQRAAEEDGATIYVDFVHVTGTPDTYLFGQGEAGDIWTQKPGDEWKKAWVDAASSVAGSAEAGSNGLRIVQNEGTGMLSIGTCDWKDYRFEVTAVPHLAEAFGVAVAYRGLTRHVRFLIHRDGTARLRIVEHDTAAEIATGKVDFHLDQKVELSVEWVGPYLRCLVNGAEPFAPVALPSVPPGGGVALMVMEGRVAFGGARVRPVVAER